MSLPKSSRALLSHIKVKFELVSVSVTTKNFYYSPLHLKPKNENLRTIPYLILSFRKRVFLRIEF